MNDLTIYQPGGLPAQPADLAKFIIVAQEKVKAVKAEIRAIQKLELAKEVYDQKMKEQREFQEVILLAYQRMGEITREIPKGSGRPSQKILPSSGKSFKIPTGGNFEKPKSQAIQDLGLSTSQVNRMEQMAAHPDIVEEVVAESQAGKTEATQGEVLRRIKERERGKVIDLADVRKERFERDMAEIDEDAKWAKAFVKATHAPFTIADHLDRVAAAVWRNAEGNISSDIEDIDMAIQMLNTIKVKLINGRRLYGRAETDYPAGQRVRHQ